MDVSRTMVARAVVSRVWSPGLWFPECGPQGCVLQAVAPRAVVPKAVFSRVWSPGLCFPGCGPQGCGLQSVVSRAVVQGCGLQEATLFSSSFLPLPTTVDLTPPGGHSASNSPSHSLVGK